ncbi:MAG: hypothetical protein QXD77_01745, partial [Candidatus Aenigmatarchaeota archaeon]
DSYTGAEVQLSLIAAAGLLLSVIGLGLSFALDGFVFRQDVYALASLLTVVFFIAVNLGTISFMAKKEKKMVFFAPAMMLIRTFAWGLGFVYGLMGMLSGAKK